MIIWLKILYVIIVFLGVIAALHFGVQTAK